MKQRTGYVYPDQQTRNLIARIIWTEALGKRRNPAQTASRKLRESFLQPI